MRKSRPVLCHKICAVAAVERPAKKATKVPPLPFVKVAGQQEMKLALLLNIVDPSIGGVLIMGDRGTGKSIAASYCNPSRLDRLLQSCMSLGFN